MPSERSTSTMKSEPGRSIVLSRPAPEVFGAGFFSPVAACAVTVVAASVAAAPFRNVRRDEFFSMEPPLQVHAYRTRERRKKSPLRRRGPKCETGFPLARERRVRRFLGKPEQPLRVRPPDLHPIGLADRAGVEPERGVVDVLERPVGGKEDAVRADLEDRVEQRLRAEVARGGEVEVVAEVVAELLLRRIARRGPGPRVSVIDPPDAVGQSLAEVA